MTDRGNRNDSSCKKSEASALSLQAVPPEQALRLHRGLAFALAESASAQAYALAAAHALQASLPAAHAALWIEDRLAAKVGEGAAPPILRPGGRSLVERAMRLGHGLQGHGFPAVEAWPLVCRSRFVGMLSVRPKSADSALLIQEAASILAAGLLLFGDSDRMADHSRRDSLTGLPNHAAMRAFLDRTLAQGEPAAVVMIDVDHFRRFNEEYGHEAGDEALRQTALALRLALPSGALAARYGGEEFAMILPGHTLEQALEAAERTRVAISRASAAGLNITASLGAAAWPDSAPDALGLFRVADEALYAAKRAGRNRVCGPIQGKAA
jgi:diguanylate cyclase (GGDEF)-like protein